MKQVTNKLKHLRLRNCQVNNRHNNSAFQGYCRIVFFCCCLNGAINCYKFNKQILNLRLRNCQVNNRYKNLEFQGYCSIVFDVCLNGAIMGHKLSQI